MKPLSILSGFFAVGALVVGLGACTANSTTFALAPSPAPPTPIPAPVLSTTSSTQSLTAGNPATFPATGVNIGGSWTVAAPGSVIPAGTTVTITLQSAVPTGTTAVANTIFYVGLKTNNTVNVGAGSIFAASLPGNFLPTGTPLSVQGFAIPPSAGWNLLSGPSLIPAVGSTTSFTAAGAYTLTGGTQYWFAVVVGPGSPITII